MTACDFEEPRLFFYLNRPRLKFDSIDESQVADWSRDSHPGVLVIPRLTLARIQAMVPHLGLSEIASVNGVNYNKGLKQVEIVALTRGASTPQTQATTVPATQP